MQKAPSYALPIVIEIIGILFIIIGIAVEILTQARIEHIITIGSVIIAIGSLVWSKIIK